MRIDEGKPAQVDIRQGAEMEQERIDGVVDIREIGSPQNSIERKEQTVEYRQLNQQGKASRCRIDTILFIDGLYCLVLSLFILREFLTTIRYQRLNSLSPFRY